MKMQKAKRFLLLFLSALMCVTTLVGFGTTAYAAEETDEVYLVSFPRDGDENYGAEWGHGSNTFMNGWSSGSSRFTTVRAMGSYNGNICYCIEVGVPQETGDRFTKKGEDFWDNYPSSYNSTISPDDIKLYIGRIFQYGYTGTISTSWRSQNEGGDKLAHAVATQLLIWETVVGERDEDFNKVNTGGKDAIIDQISPNHPLRDKIMNYYNSMAASVLSFIMIMTVYGRFFKLYLYTAIAPVPLSAFAGEPTQNVGKSFIKSYAAVCLEGAIIVLGSIIFSLFASAPPVVDPNAAAVTQVWSYIGELIFNMIVLVGAVKMADRVVREMMGL